MRRVSTVAALVAAGMLALAGTATANVGDIDSVEIDDELTGTAQQVTVSGQVQCVSGVEYGVVAKVTQPPETATLGELTDQPETGTGTQGDADAEGVGAYGPDASDITDDNPCDGSAKDYDVVVQVNEGSDDFSDGDMGVELTVGTSAQDGERGPGPIVGDVENVFETVEFATDGAE